MSATSAAPAASAAQADNAVVTVTNLVAGYLPGVNILHGCSIEARKGELIGIIGKMEDYQRSSDRAQLKAHKPAPLGGT